MFVVFSVFSFVLFSAIPIPELIQCYHLTFFISLWTGQPITFQVACLFCLGGLFGLFGFWFCFCCFGRGCVFSCFSLWMVTAAGLYTGPFPVHFCGSHPGWRLLVCINQLIYQHAAERVEPGESQRGVFFGRKK